MATDTVDQIPQEQQTQEVGSNSEEQNPNVEESSSNEGDKPMSKTEASWRTKGDKSYYYWHKHVSNKIPIESPTLVNKTVVEIVEEKPAFKSVTNYYWMDDDKNVKVYVELAKLDGNAELHPLTDGDLECVFSEKGFELKIKNYRSVDYQLKLSNLKNKINIENSTCKKLKTKVLITLRKEDETTKWWDLLEKK
jgi:hypothetical protein